MRILLVATPDIPAESGGGFTSTSFRDLLQHRILCPGLDSNFSHTLIDVWIAPDANSATLTIQSEPRQPLVLDRFLRVVTGTPEAHICVVDAAGVELTRGCYSAPLALGQLIEIGLVRYTVTEVDWPSRDPVSGICTGALDVQRVAVTPDPAPAMMPSLDPQEAP